MKSKHTGALLENDAQSSGEQITAIYNKTQCESFHFQIA